MKKFISRAICLSLICKSLLPSALEGKTRAFSPNIPGQPLIFNVSKPSISSFERILFSKLSRHDLESLLELTANSTRLSEDLLGLVTAMNLPMSTPQRQSIVNLYNQDISITISLINDTFRSLKGSSSKKLANLVEQTLTSFVQITNKMLVDSAGNPSNQLFQQDYQLMQVNVINYFNSMIDEMSRKLNPNLKSESKNGIEGLVSCMSLYISNTNSMVVGGVAGPRNMVFSRQQVIKNLAQFLSSIFAAQATRRSCGR